jgi:hypothetical protein
VLHWDVFVTPGIPIVTRDMPPGVRETYFQAMASTLIYGVRDAVLVDAFMTVKQANALADWVAARGKNLTTTYITHGLNVPSIGLVVAGDAAYNDVHLYLAESNAETRREWIAALDKIESLNPRAVVASHKRPENDDDPKIIEQTRQYIRDFDRLAETTTTAHDLYDRMLELYPNRVNPGWALWSSARAVKR